MNLNQLRQVMYDRIAAYWAGATVVWGATQKVQPHMPLVVLQFGTVTRAVQPVTQAINSIPFSAYPSEVPIQIDLFTKGRTVATAAGSYSENTATGDLLDFINYLDSPATIAWSSRNDISLSLISGVQDLSEVINGSQWQYRAMAEILVTFTQWAAEANGVLSEASIVYDANGKPVGVNSADWQQTASGGGTAELADGKTGYFDELGTRIEGEFSNE